MNVCMVYIYDLPIPSIIRVWLPPFSLLILSPTVYTTIHYFYAIFFIHIHGLRWSYFSVSNHPFSSLNQTNQFLIPETLDGQRPTNLTNPNEAVSS